MSQISQKSISGITSITTPAGIDNQFTLHTNDTSQAAKLDSAGNFHFSNHVNTTGISSASNFKTGSSNLHSSGLSAASIDVGNNIKLGNAGVITATSFVGDGSDLTNLPAGLGTALSATASSPLNKMYYTNQVLGVPGTVTVDVPASASKAYTQYADIKVESTADLIIAEGDDLIPDILGLADFGTFGGGASAGRIRVNSISNAANDGSPTVQKGLVVTGVTTSTTFSGSGASLTNLPAAQLTGALPALDGSNLTGLSGVSVANQSDNRLITCTGTTDSLNGEQYLTYSSQSSLNLTDGNGTSNLGGNYLLLKRSTGNTNYINAPLANADLVISADENLLFHTVHTADYNSTERARIDSSGRLLVGTTTTGISQADDLTLGNSDHCGMTIRSGSTKQGNLFFTDISSGDQFQGYVQYDHSGNDLKLGTSKIARLLINSDGHVTTPYTVSFMARGMSGSSFDSGTMTGLSSGHNIGNHYNSSTGIFTAPVAGRYLTGCGVLVQSGSGRLEGNISLNNSTTIVNFNGTGTTYDGTVAICIVQMSANDTLRVKRQSGNAYDSGHGNHYFFAHLLG